MRECGVVHGLVMSGEFMKTLDKILHESGNISGKRERMRGTGKEHSYGTVFTGVRTVYPVEKTACEDAGYPFRQWSFFVPANEGSRSFGVADRLKMIPDRFPADRDAVFKNDFRFRLGKGIAFERVLTTM